jgi:hypothetical protein
MPTPPAQVPYGSPAELWYWNGLALQDPYGGWNISTFGGSRFALPVLRGQNVAAPYRAGQGWKSKYPDARTVTLTMWADGQGFGGSSGSYPSGNDPRLSFNSNWQQLRQAFWTRNALGSVQGQLQRNWYYKQGGTATLVQSTAMAEIAGSMDLTMNSRTNAAFSVDLLLSDPYFYGAQQSHAVTTAGANLTGLGEGIAGEGFPSAVNSFTVTLSGAATVQNTTAGTSFTVLSGPVFPVVVDVLNNTVTDHTGASVPGYFSHTGSRLWACIMPGTNAIAVSAGTATWTWNDVYV